MHRDRETSWRNEYVVKLGGKERERFNMLIDKANTVQASW
jgi:hypothetical protein